jgi:hypothetical protein
VKGGSTPPGTRKPTPKTLPLCPKLIISRQIPGRAWLPPWGDPTAYLDALWYILTVVRPEVVVMMSGMWTVQSDHLGSIHGSPEEITI